MNKFVCVRTEVQTLFGENIIYLHNLHKLLLRHITRFVSALRSRSLPPVFPREEGTATRRLARTEKPHHKKTKKQCREKVGQQTAKDLKANF